jgi:hypothetical protein
MHCHVCLSADHSTPQVLFAVSISYMIHMHCRNIQHITLQHRTNFFVSVLNEGTWKEDFNCKHRFTQVVLTAVTNLAFLAFIFFSKYHRTEWVWWGLCLRGSQYVGVEEQWDLWVAMGKSLSCHTDPCEFPQAPLQYDSVPQLKRRQHCAGKKRVFPLDTVKTNEKGHYKTQMQQRK